MRDEEGGLDRAAVRIVAALLEQFAIDFDVVVVHSIVERDHDHLRHRVWL